MAPALGVGVINKRSAAVPQCAVVDELHLTRLEVEIDRQPVFFDDVEHRRNRSCPPGVDRLTPQRVAAVDLVHAEPRLQFSGVLEHRRGKHRTFARVKFALPVEPERLVEALSRLPRAPAALVCASAVGYYGSRGDEILEETSPAGSGFLPEVCVAWEKAARAASDLGPRVTSIRIGVVLDSRGGALGRLLAPFRAGVGGRLGSGRQWMSRIHVGDLVELFRFVLDSPLKGAVNGVAPFPVSNSEFTT